MYRLLTNREKKIEGDETFCISGIDFGWYKIRTSSIGSLWLDGDLPVRRKISDTSEAEKPTANTCSLQLLNRMKTVLPMVKNGMNSVQMFAVRGVIADAIDQLQGGA